MAEEINTTLFSDLPAALRCKIWEYCLPGPRIVEVFIKGILLPPPEGEGEWEYQRNVRNGPIYITSSPLPTPLLHINQESRALVKKHYTLLFETSSSPPRIYFNLAIDILYLPYWSFRDGSEEFVDNTGSTGPQLVQHVAFDLDKYYDYQLKEGFLNYQIELEKWPLLRTVTFATMKARPGESYCSCCEEARRPEVLGGIGFAELKEEEMERYKRFLESCTEELEDEERKELQVKTVALLRRGECVFVETTGHARY